MTSKEALQKIKELFGVEAQLPAPAPLPVPNQTLAGDEYILQDGSKIMISILDVGGIVSLEDGTPAPDGEYKLADGLSIVVSQGEIAQLIPASQEPAAEPVAEPAEPLSEPMAEPVAGDPIAEPNEPAAEPVDEVAMLKEKIAALEAMIAEILAKLGGAEAAMSEQNQKVQEGFKVMTDYLEAAQKAPSADPIKKPAYNFTETKAKQLEQFEAMKQAISNIKK